MRAASRQSRRLPLHPRPLPHEALSSWVGRLATAYDMETDLFLRTAFGADPAPSDRELDTGAISPELAAALTERTGVPRRSIGAMTLPGLMSKLSSGFLPAIQRGWFSTGTAGKAADPAITDPPAPWQAADLLDGLPQGCPRCFLTDLVPYIRLHWRGAWMRNCPWHQHALVRVTRAPWLFRPDIPWEQPRADFHAVDLDWITLGAVTDGVAQLPGWGGPVPGAAWLRALRVLLAELACPQLWRSSRTRAEVEAAWRRSGWTFHGRTFGRSEPFERLRPDLRGVLFDVAAAEILHRARSHDLGSRGLRLRATIMQWRTDPQEGLAGPSETRKGKAKRHKHRRAAPPEPLLPGVNYFLRHPAPFD